MKKSKLKKWWKRIDNILNARCPRAFDSTWKYEYYILRKDIPGVAKGAVFYWDKKDSIRGSIGEGCLKLCWKPDGNCYSDNKTNYGLCGDTIIFHASSREDKRWFKKYEETR